MPASPRIEDPVPGRSRRLRARRHAVTLMAAAAAVLAGCAATKPPASPTASYVQMPVLQGWFEGEAVFYVTTDVSDAAVAAKHRANFAPRLAAALPREPAVPGQPSSVDKVYAVTNFEQGSVRLGTVANGPDEPRSRVQPAVADGHRHLGCGADTAAPSLGRSDPRRR